MPSVPSVSSAGRTAFPTGMQQHGQVDSYGTLQEGEDGRYPGEVHPPPAPVTSGQMRRTWARHELEVDTMEQGASDLRQLQLDERLTFLEFVAQAAAAAAPGGAQDVSGDMWVPGGRDFGEGFIKAPLNGYYVDKTKIHHREAWLEYKRLGHQNHHVVNMLAGHSERREAALQRVLRERAWRNLYDFDE